MQILLVTIRVYQCSDCIVKNLLDMCVKEGGFTLFFTVLIVSRIYATVNSYIT